MLHLILVIGSVVPVLHEWGCWSELPLGIR